MGFLSNALKKKKNKGPWYPTGIAQLMKAQAYIRSIGYGGKSYGAPGFMMWSGSVLQGNNDDN